MQAQGGPANRKNLPVYGGQADGGEIDSGIKIFQGGIFQ